MAWEHGGAYGDRPPQAAGQPYPGQGEWYRSQSRESRRLQRRNRRTYRVAVAASLLAVAGLVVSGIGLAGQLMPRTFSAAQQRQITDWEYGQRWRDLTAGEIFPATVTYQPPVVLDDDPSLTLGARLIGTAQQAACGTQALDAAAAAVLDHEGCEAVLRATYVDDTGSYVITVGAAVLPSSAQAADAAKGLGGLSDGGVRTVPFANTPASSFTDSRRQLGGSVVSGVYVVLYTVGYADSRPHVDVSADSYTDGEMTSAGRGVASTVLSVLAKPVPAPHCPGTPGC